VGAAVACACGPTIQRQAPRTFEFWTGGDDGLTQRFADGLEKGLAASPAFLARGPRDARTLVVSVPDHLDWEDVGTRTRVKYEVVLTDRTGRRVGRTKGTCWEDHLHECVESACAYVEKVATRIP
jgi:hypothetical protein